jgi:hypothetical protein
MRLIDAVLSSLRITSPDYDNEIQELIDQAVSDLISAGVKPGTYFPDWGTSAWSSEINDFNIRRAIMLYCKANFGVENDEKDWFMQQYLQKKAEILNQVTQFTDYDESKYQ